MGTKKRGNIKFPTARPDRRTWLCGAAGALFLGFSGQWGRQLDRVGNVNLTAPSTWIVPFLCFCALTPILAWGFAWAAARQRTSGGQSFGGQCFGEQSAGGKRRLLLRALFLAACWGVVLLAVFPGFFAYDATDELNEVLTGEYVTRHPLVHVLLLGKTVEGVHELTGSWNAGIAVYVLVQMGIMAVLFSLAVEQLRSLGAGRRVRAAMTVFLGIFPVIPMYVLCTSKDLPYTACLLAVMLLCVLLLRDREAFWKSRGKTAGLWAALLGTAVWRSNGLLVLVFLLPALLWLAGRGHRRRMAALAATALGAYLGLQAGLGAVLKPVSTNAMESLTVPIQQLARAWNYSPELFSEQEQETLLQILPQEALESYQPKLSDPVKILFSTEQFSKDPGKYAALWLKIGCRAPSTYLNAWLMTSYGFWYPDAKIDVYNGLRNYTESSYFSCETEPPGERKSFFPALEKVYEEISWEQRIHEIPVLSWLFSPGALCWLWVLSGLYLLSLGRKRELAALLPVYLNLLTVLPGPTYLVRYVLIFWFGLPVLLAACRYWRE
ncbi:MAG: DUF6020 family protein [Eubacteriales bacterium]|nr:DUF6020 family protein [Eubacteriales bacterium]